MASKTANKAGDLDAVPKHRACDECRSRKLACSKEADGCSRCKREGMQCHYSPQKPMGRPRKRRHVEEEEEAPPPKQQVPVTDEGITNSRHQIQNPFSAYSFDDALPLDPSLNFLDSSAPPNLDFLDLIPNYAQTASYEPQIYAPDDTYGYYNPTAIPITLSGVELLNGINFDEPDPSQTAIPKDVSDSLERYMVHQWSQPLEPVESTPAKSTPTKSTPSDSAPNSNRSNSVDSPEPPASTMRAIPTVNCGCLSSLYLALDSLSTLPSEVTTAMRVARNAVKVAHDVINCPTCAIPLLEDPAIAPPIQCFQNLMFLGALVPSACNAYAAILEMVDVETTSAKAEGRNFWFTFKDVGGLWGQLGGGEAKDCCNVVEMYNNKKLPPDQWRMMIRAILRLDVYGVESLDIVEQNRPMSMQYQQQGLKDVVKSLEERSRKRHDKLDELMESGEMPKTGPFGVIYSRKPCPPEERNCMKILETARIALDNLVIA
ncbi:hypothetical protein G7046_g2891 [Stylonectria norvegica]|nr:hypothetical protein G7046_g2891 [Stylonectria norvegica]